MTQQEIETLIECKNKAVAQLNELRNVLNDLSKTLNEMGLKIVNAGFENGKLKQLDILQDG